MGRRWRGREESSSSVDDVDGDADAGYGKDPMEGRSMSGRRA